MAALAACNTIQGRLVDFAAEHWGVPESQVEFLPGFVRVGNQKVVFADFIEAAYMARVSLSSTGFYKTPKIHWYRKSGPGRPFYYYSYCPSASASVVGRSDERRFCTECVVSCRFWLSSYNFNKKHQDF